MSLHPELRASLPYPSARPGGDRVLLVMLPGAGIEAEDFAARGLVAAAQAGEAAVDVLALRPELDLYLEGRIAAVLHEAVTAARPAAPAPRLWLLGISLGGMGALLYASVHPDRVAGLILLAPFLGTHGTMAEVARAGGFSAWSPAGSAATAPERAMLGWLRHHLRNGGGPPAIFLGHGARDRFAAGHRMLAAELPPERVVQVEGGHDWPSWAEAWAAILARRPFG